MICGVGGKVTEKIITFQYIPLEEGLKALLSNQEVQDQVGILFDFNYITIYVCYRFFACIRDWILTLRIFVMEASFKMIRSTRSTRMHYS